MTRQLTPAAQVAKLCKQYLKSLGIQCKVRSSNFSMGNSVTVTVQDQTPTMMKKIHAELDKYQQGHFDGMTDMYEYSNSRRDIPQTKFLFIENAYSDDLCQKAWDFLRNLMSGYDVFPADYKELNKGFYRHPNSSYNVTLEVYHVLNGIHSFGSDFWDKKAA